MRSTMPTECVGAAGRGTGAAATGASSRGSRIGAGCDGLTLVTAGVAGTLRLALVSAIVASLRGVPRW